MTTFCLEAHVTYHREVRHGDPLRFTTVLLGHDAKRVHYIHAMYHATEGYLAATNELMSLHVHLATRRGGPMAAEVVARLARIQAAHDTLPRPPQGRPPHRPDPLVVPTRLPPEAARVPSLPRNAAAAQVASARHTRELRVKIEARAAPVPPARMARPLQPGSAGVGP